MGKTKKLFNPLSLLLLLLSLILAACGEDSTILTPTSEPSKGTAVVETPATATPGQALPTVTSSAATATPVRIPATVTPVSTSPAANPNPASLTTSPASPSPAITTSPTSPTVNPDL